MAYNLAYTPFHDLEAIGVTGKTENLVTYTYKDGTGRLKAITYANGHVMKATYNGFGQMVAEKWYDAEETLIAHYKYVYDAEGNIVRSIDIFAAKAYDYTYDDGHVVSANAFDITLNDEMVTKRELTHTIRYYYNKEGTLTGKQVNADGNVVNTRYTTPEEGQPETTVTVGDTAFTSRSKNDHLGRKEFDELQIGGEFLSRQFNYHIGEVTDTHKNANKVKSTPTTQLVSQIAFSDGRTIAYEYDPEERITKVTDSVDGITEYTYDPLGQLLSETVNGVVVNQMTYDNYGNILTKNGVEYTYGDSTWKDLLTAYGDQTITYDAQGNPTSYLGHTLTWEKGRQLKSFDGIEYTYNANGIRTSKTVGDVKHEYVLDGTKILRETWGNNTLIPLYDNEDSVCGIVYNGTPYYFQKNLQGDIISLVTEVTVTDENGQKHTEQQVVARYAYDAWGVCTIVTDTSGVDIATINPFRYRGYYYDTEIGLYYLQKRYYDANTGRFVNGDEVSFALLFGSNLFNYCLNVPINRQDSTGCCSVSTSQLQVNPNEFKIKVTWSKVQIHIPWQAAIFLGVIFLVIRGCLIKQDIKSVHQLTNCLPATVAMTLTYYIPLTLIAELVSAVCHITSVVMVVSTLLSVATAGVTGGLTVVLEPVLKLILKELGKALLNYAIPSLYDCVQMISRSVQYKKSCRYVFKYIGGASIQF